MSKSNWHIRFLGIFLRNLRNSDIADKASSLAYYLILSIFPLLIFFLNTLSMFFKARQGMVIKLVEVLPQGAANIVRDILIGIIRNSNGTLLSISLIIAIWTGSSGISKLIHTINETYGITSKNFVLERIYAVFFTIAFEAIMLMIFVSIIFGDVISSLLITNVGAENFIYSIWLILKSTIPSIFMVITFTLLYKFTLRSGKAKEVKIKHALIGAIVTSISWGVLTKFFSYYVNSFGKFDRVYGSIGGVIILIIWLYISAIVMILGSYIAKSLGDVEKV